MHHAFNAFLLLSLIIASAFVAVAPMSAFASLSPVKFGVRVWNYNTTHTFQYAEVSLQNKTTIKALDFTNGTGWANLTAPNPGSFTLQVTLHAITVYNATLVLYQNTTFINLTSTNVADYSIMFADSLARHVPDAKADLRVNSSLISSTFSAANGTTIARNLPFHSYNITATREGVFITNRTIVVNATTYKRNTFITIPIYKYTLTVRDYVGANIIQTGTVGIYDFGVPTNNATNNLSMQTMFGNLWPGKYWVVVTSRNATIWRSLVTITSNTTHDVMLFGYSITLHVFDALNRPIPAVPVNLVQNGIIVATQKTDGSGIVTFTNLPETVFQLNFTLLRRSYATPANITGTPLDLNIKIDDVLILAGVPFNTAPLAGSSALILTVIAILGTAFLYRRRKGLSEASTAKSKESSNNALRSNDEESTKLDLNLG